jgi:hypothetical protein
LTTIAAFRILTPVLIESPMSCTRSDSFHAGLLARGWRPDRRPAVGCSSLFRLTCLQAAPGSPFRTTRISSRASIRTCAIPVQPGHRSPPTFPLVVVRGIQLRSILLGTFTRSTNSFVVVYRARGDDRARQSTSA